MARCIAVLNVVGLSPDMIGPHTPHLAALADRGHMAPLEAPLTAATHRPAPAAARVRWESSHAP